MLMGLLGWVIGAGVKKFITKKAVSWWMACLISFPILVGFALAVGPTAGAFAAAMAFLSLNGGYTAPEGSKRLIPWLIDKLRGVYGRFLALVTKFRRGGANKRGANKVEAALGAAYEDENDEHLYLQVDEELKSGSRKEGLWYKAEAEADGDLNKTRALYLKWRVAQLSEEIRAKREREMDERRQSKETTRKEKEEEEAADVWRVDCGTATACIKPLERFGYVLTYDLKYHRNAVTPATWQVRGKYPDDDFEFTTVHALQTFARETLKEELEEERKRKLEKAKRISRQEVGQFKVGKKYFDAIVVALLLIAVIVVVGLWVLIINERKASSAIETAAPTSILEQTFEFDYGLTIRIPKDWENESEERRGVREGLLDGLNLPAGKIRLLNAAPRVPSSVGYARVRLSIETGQVLSQIEARYLTLTQPLMSALKDEFLTGMRKQNLPNGLIPRVHPNSISFSKIQTDEGYWGILLSYIREGIEGDVMVEQYKIHFSDKLVLVTVSYNMAKQEELKPIADRIWNSLRIVDKQRWPLINSN